MYGFFYKKAQENNIFLENKKLKYLCNKASKSGVYTLNKKSQRLKKIVLNPFPFASTTPSFDSVQPRLGHRVTYLFSSPFSLRIYHQPWIKSISTLPIPWEPPSSVLPTTAESFSEPILEPALVRSFINPNLNH